MNLVKFALSTTSASGSISVKDAAGSIVAGLAQAGVFTAALAYLQSQTGRVHPAWLAFVLSGFLGVIGSAWQKFYAGPSLVKTPGEAANDW